MADMQTVQEAFVVLNTMKETQPGIHVDVLEAGFRELWLSSQAEAVNRKLIEVKTAEFISELTANIPLTPPDPAWDPNNEFKRAAVDRLERAKRFSDELRQLVEPTTKLTPAAWGDKLGVVVIDADGWAGDEEDWNRPLFRSDYLSRLSISTIRLLSWSVLR